MLTGLRSVVLPMLCLAAAHALGATPAAASSVLLYDTTGDRVLYAEDADQPWYAASLTKMMTAYVVFDAWKSGRLTKDTRIVVSEKANAQPKMRLGLGKGKELSLDHAVKALIIVSANDIAYAIAEGVSGDAETFVAAMNATAVRLGMTGTRFINPHGLPGRGQYTTAQDMARLAAALLRDYPEHMEYFGIRTTEIGDKKKRTIGTHNPVLVNTAGGDGFKTGFTCSAAYNIVGSATRDGRRLVAVVMGEESSAKRAVKVNALLEYGFKMLAWKDVLPAQTIHSLPGGFYDRLKAREVNLEQRYKDCRDADPEETVALVVASAVSMAGALAAQGVVVPARADAGAAAAAAAPVVKAVATEPAAKPAAAPAATAAARPAEPGAKAVAAPAQATGVAKAAQPIAAAAPAGAKPAPAPAPAVTAAKPASGAPANAAPAAGAKAAAVPPPAGQPAVGTIVPPVGRAAPAASAAPPPSPKPAPAPAPAPAATVAAKPAEAAVKPADGAAAGAATKPAVKPTAKRKQKKKQQDEGSGFSLASPF